MKLKDKILIAALLIVVGFGVWVGIGGLSNRAAPDINLSIIDGRSLSLKALQGKPVLVTFWATDCVGCIREMPHLVEFHQEFANKGLTIVGVAMYYDRPDRVLAMAEAKSLPYAIALDPKAEASRAFGDVRLTPTNFLIDARGKIVEQKIGEFDPEAWRARISKLLEQNV